MENKPLQIDVDALFKKRSPKVYKWVPKFILSWIKKVIHQKEMNDAMMEAKDLRDIPFTKFVIHDKLQTTMSNTGIENIPKTGGAIVVSNHPLGGLDGMMLMVEVSKVRPDVRVIVNEILAEIPNFGDIFIPVNNLGKKAKESLKRVEEAYAQGFLVIVFPAGLCSRKTKGVVQDLEWQKSFISRAVKYQLPVIPTLFQGKNTNRFYNIANFRKWLKLKINIEMFFLVDEMFKQKGKNFNIIFGEPIMPETFEKHKNLGDWKQAQIVKEYVYSLNNPNRKSYETLAGEIEK
ncbi:MAG: 1-acyl-sn-glycerol-3-phosphate acyltransferase [Bacteroidia bacterium]|nr:1-acyl-sn-glycerol-3-phosphate acyltransferase [Bacteroidia bacterium]